VDVDQLDHVTKMETSFGEGRGNRTDWQLNG
jgi:hypothetical protein